MLPRHIIILGRYSILSTVYHAALRRTLQIRGIPDLLISLQSFAAVLVLVSEVGKDSTVGFITHHLASDGYILSIVIFCIATVWIFRHTYSL